MSTSGRPRHDFKAFVRSMQMSKASVFLFVEGRDSDQYFYGRLADELTAKMSIICSTVVAKELSHGEGGGKTVLRAFHAYLKKSRKLADRRFGKVTSSFFFADKDIDDVLRTKVRCAHFKYTQMYCVENHLFRNANLQSAIAATLGLPESEVPEEHRTSLTWCKQSSTRWIDWVAFCVLAKMLKAQVANYGVTYSPINNNRVDATSAPLLRKQLDELATKTSLSRDEVGKKYARTLARVKQLFALDRHDEVFSGKWYAHMLEAELALRLRGRCNFNGFRRSLMTSLRSQCSDFPCRKTADEIVELVALQIGK